MPRAVTGWSPRFRYWVVLVAALVGVGVTASLGRWQLSRAAHKEQLQADIASRQAMPPWTLVDLQRLGPGVDASLAHHRQAELSGRWLPEATVYLDNRPMDGRAGFYVVTPLQLEGDGRVMAVLRGWTPRDPLDRTRVPEVPTPSGVVTLHGRLAPPPSRMVALGAESPGRIRQNLDMDQLQSELKAEVLPLSLLLSDPPAAPVPALADGLLRHWPTAFPDVHKHHGYALQWFGLCTLIVVLYAWFQIIRPRRHAASPS